VMRIRSVSTFGDMGINYVCTFGKAIGYGGGCAT
jgi:hypothetical protein